MISELIKKEKVELGNSQNGHLCLTKRIAIAKTLGNHSFINKVFLECCKFIYQEFNLNDNSIAKILSLAEDFLYQNKPTDFIKIYNQNRNYLLSFSQEPYLGIGLACLTLCGTISCNAENILEIEDYNGEDDNTFDPEDWFTDFLLSNTYSGGNPFLKTGDIEKRKTFWNQYLDLVLKIVQSPDVPKSPKIIINEENLSEKIIRTKDFSNKFINETLEKVIKLILTDLEEVETNAQWTKIEIEGNNIGSMGMRAYYFDIFNEEHHLELSYYLYNDDQSSAKLMQKVKENIYQQSPREGTWFSYKIIITPDKNFMINYNFDEFKIYEGKVPNKEDFIDEFSKYPRAKDFVPKWWQNIIKKHNPEYLE